jgi:hypothetical protein
MAAVLSPRLSPQKMPTTKRGSLTSALPLSAMMAASITSGAAATAVFSNLSAGSMKNLFVQQLDKLNPKGFVLALVLLNAFVLNPTIRLVMFFCDRRTVGLQTRVSLRYRIR